MVAAQCLAMVAHDAQAAPQVGVGCAAVAHRHAVLVDIRGGDVAHKDEAQQQFKVRRHLIACVKQAVALVHLSAAIEGRVGGHESQAHGPAREASRTVIAQTAVEVVGGHIVDVAIHRLGTRLLQCLHNALEHRLVRIEIVRIENANDIARGH